MEKFLLGTFLSNNKLNIVNQENIIVPVLFTEFGGGGIVLVPDGIDQLIGEFLGGDV